MARIVPRVFLRTRYTARLWWGPLQLQVWRPSEYVQRWTFVAAWNAHPFRVLVKEF